VFPELGNEHALAVWRHRQALRVLEQIPIGIIMMNETNSGNLRGITIHAPDLDPVCIVNLGEAIQHNQAGAVGGKVCPQDRVEAGIGPHSVGLG
jgi:hypothetical protein